MNETDSKQMKKQMNTETDHHRKGRGQCAGTEATPQQGAGKGFMHRLRKGMKAGMCQMGKGQGRGRGMRHGGGRRGGFGGGR